MKRVLQLSRQDEEDESSDEDESESVPDLDAFQQTGFEPCKEKRFIVAHAKHESKEHAEDDGEESSEEALVARLIRCRSKPILYDGQGYNLWIACAGQESEEEDDSESDDDEAELQPYSAFEPGFRFYHAYGPGEVPDEWRYDRGDHEQQCDSLLALSCLRSRAQLRQSGLPTSHLRHAAEDDFDKEVPRCTKNHEKSRDLQAASVFKARFSKC